MLPSSSCNADAVGSRIEEQGFKLKMEDKGSDEYLTLPSSILNEGRQVRDVSRESASKAVDMHAIDDIIQQNVEQQSELEYLDSMILTQLQQQGSSSHCMSDADGPEISIEEQLLRQVQLESEKELFEKYDLDFSMRHAAESHTTVASPYEDSLELALKESLLQHQRTTSSIATATNTSRDDEVFDNSSFHTDDEILQMALEQSLQSYSSSMQQSYNNNRAIGGGIRPDRMEASSGRTFIIPLTASTVAVDGDSVEDLDEELMRAIEESLRR